MTPWNPSYPDQSYYRFLESRGWTEAGWIAAPKVDHTMERVEYNGGLEKTGILRELPGAIRETVADQAAAVGGAVTSTHRFLKRTLFAVGGVGLIVASVVYRNEIKAAVRTAGRFTKK